MGGSLAYLQLHNVNITASLKTVIDILLSRFSTYRLPILKSNLKPNIQSVVGLLLITFAIGLIDRKSAFPGYWVLLPTLGACFVIAAGPMAIGNRLLLSAKQFVWIGLLSYPLYLWHWPLLSFATIMETKTAAVEIRATAVVLAFGLAWLTYFLIEQPVRFGKGAIKTKICALVFLMLVVVSIASIGYLNTNLRSPNLTDAMLAQIEKLKFALHFEKWTSCPEQGDTWNCKVLNPNRPTQIALIGDSHSVHLASGLAELESIKKYNIISRNNDGCMPVFEIEWEGKSYYKCNKNVDNALNWAISDKDINVIMLSGYAVWKIRPTDDQLVLENIPAAQAKRSAKILQTTLNLTLERLAASGKKIIFFVDTPVINFNPTECVSIRPLYFSSHTLKEPCAFSRALFNQRNIEYHQMIKMAEEKFPQIIFIHLYEHLCDENLCYAMKDGILLYMDHSHLSADGSRYLMNKIKEQLVF